MQTTIESLNEQIEEDKRNSEQYLKQVRTLFQMQFDSSEMNLNTQYIL